MININDTLGLKLFEVASLKKSYYKLHEKFKKFKVPPFLMKLNLRKPPKGNLTDELIREIAAEYVLMVRAANIKFDLVAGLPNAGVPFAEAFIKIWNNSYPDKKGIIYLEKEETENYRRILPNISGEYKKGEIVLLIDDVISLAGSKMEATDALRGHELIVTHGVVLMDWELGGVEILFNKYGVKLIVVFTASKLLSLWQANKRIFPRRRRRIIKRVRKIKKLIEKYSAENPCQADN